MTLTDKEKVRKALAKITKIIDEYKSWKPPNEKDPDVIKDFEEIKCDLSGTVDSEMDYEIKITNALSGINHLLDVYFDIGHSHEEISDLKKVKKILES